MYYRLPYLGSYIRRIKSAKLYIFKLVKFEILDLSCQCRLAQFNWSTKVSQSNNFAYFSVLNLAYVLLN